jgi:hypothetical protein
MALIRNEYSTLITKLRAFEGYLANMGLRRGPDRLRQLITRIEQCEEARKKGQLGLLQCRPDVEDLVWSLVEGTEFAGIYEGLKGYDSTVIKKLADKALSGPLHPGLEKPSNSGNVARNTAFELRLGAGLRAEGAQITLDSQADLVVDYAGMHVVIECKRPLFDHQIRGRIQEARRQLKRRLDADCHPLHAGLVAISVSKTVNPGSCLFRAAHPDALRSLSKNIDSLHQQYSHDYDKWVDIRLVGIMYHLFTPAYVESDQLLTAAAQTKVFLSGSNMQAMFPVSNGKALESLLTGAFQS